VKLKTTTKKSDNPYKYEGWIEGKGIEVLESTCVGFIGETFPMSRGNCFSLMVKSKHGEESCRVLNFCIENLEELVKRKIIKLPVKVLVIPRPNGNSRGICVIHDTRIPHEWYYEDFCPTCSPIELLTPAQRLMKWRKIDSGVLVCQNGFETEGIQTKTEKLKVKWSIESEQDFKQAGYKLSPAFITLPSGILVPPTQEQFNKEVQRRVGKPSDMLKRYGVKRVNKNFYAKVKVEKRK
jgi:hypothetical protein